MGYVGGCMNPEHLFVDKRLLGKCVYCGGVPDTVDHVPSKILLDDPLPQNLPVVESCARCNQSVSSDEEYLACFLESVLVGSSSPAAARRPKIKAALNHSPKLADRIQASGSVVDGGNWIWNPDLKRIRNVVLKLARGHAAYELSLAQTDEPTELIFVPFSLMPMGWREEFESAGSGELRGWPEIGSRAFLRAAGAPPFADSPGPWITVQPGQYRYFVDEDGGVRVQIVISEYLASVVIWE